MSEQERYYAHAEVAALLAEQERQWRAGAAMLGLGMAGDNRRRVKRWKILTAAAALVGLLAGGVAGVEIERQTIVRPCVRALDNYREGIQALNDYANSKIDYATAAAKLTVLRAQRDQDERTCLG